MIEENAASKNLQNWDIIPQKQAKSIVSLNIIPDTITISYYFKILKNLLTYRKHRVVY
jgi:hypothetical protein